MKHHKYMTIARAVAGLSKDPSTKVGALIVGPDWEVRSLGYNGAPRGCAADEDERFERPEKYWWAAHAEANAITNAARVGTPLNGCTLICTHVPCMACAKLIVQAGITCVAALLPDQEFAQRWAEDFVRTERLFVETGVQLKWIQTPTD